MSNSRKNERKEKGDEDMATKIITENYTLNEREALKILEAPVKEIKQTTVEHGYVLTKEDRIIQARKILDSNK